MRYSAKSKCLMWMLWHRNVVMSAEWILTIDQWLSLLHFLENGSKYMRWVCSTVTHTTDSSNQLFPPFIILTKETWNQLNKICSPYKPNHHHHHHHTHHHHHQQYQPPNLLQTAQSGIKTNKQVKVGSQISRLTFLHCQAILQSTTEFNNRVWFFTGKYRNNGFKSMHFCSPSGKKHNIAMSYETF